MNDTNRPWKLETRSQEARARLASWYRSGDLRPRYDRAEGFERLPATLIGMLKSANLGKQVVVV